MFISHELRIALLYSAPKAKETSQVLLCQKSYEKRTSALDAVKTDISNDLATLLKGEKKTTV